MNERIIRALERAGGLIVEARVELHKAQHAEAVAELRLAYQHLCRALELEEGDDDDHA